VDRRFPLVEIFGSFQGEGRNAGLQCVFVRFAGCNFSCPWCDTDKRENFSAAADEIVEEVSRYPMRNVILTGGEPTAVQGVGELVEALKRNGWWVAVETNGSADAQWLALADYVACSPKCEYPDRIALRRADEVRVVASRGADETEAFCRMVEKIVEAKAYYVSPCDRPEAGGMDFPTAKSVLARLPRWSLSVQLHKILGFR